MRTNLLKSLFASAIMLFSIALNAEETRSGYWNVVSLYADDMASTYNISPNGDYVCGHLDLDNKLWNASVWDAKTGKRTYLVEKMVGEGTDASVGGAYDVSNDGTVVAGSKGGLAGFWLNGEFRALETDNDTTSGGSVLAYTNGFVTSMTFVGEDTIMVGCLHTSSFSRSKAAYWINGKFIDKSDLVPSEDLAGQPRMMAKFWAVSTDGKTIAGSVNFNYLEVDGGAAIRAFVITEKNGKDTVIDLMERPECEDYRFIDMVEMSRNGRYIGGWLNDGDSDNAFIYDVQEDKFEIIANGSGKGTFALTDEGNCAVLSPTQGYPGRYSEYYLNGELLGFDQWVKDSLHVTDEQIISVSDGSSSLGGLYDISADGQVFSGTAGLSATFNWIIRYVDNTDVNLTVDNSKNAAYYDNGMIIFNNEVVKVEVYNIAGTLVQAEDVYSTSIAANLNYGLYIVRMYNTDGSISTSKIIVR